MIAFNLGRVTFESHCYGITFAKGKPAVDTYADHKFRSLLPTLLNGGDVCFTDPVDGKVKVYVTPWYHQLVPYEDDVLCCVDDLFDLRQVVGLKRDGSIEVAYEDGQGEACVAEIERRDIFGKVVRGR